MRSSFARSESEFDDFFRANSAALEALGWSLTGDSDLGRDLAQYALVEAAGHVGQDEPLPGACGLR